MELLTKMSYRYIRPVVSYRLPRARVRQIASALLFSLALMLAANAFASNDAAITRAWQLVDSQDYQAAYELLAPLEGEEAGAPVYDYLLGISALRSGQPGIALFPLERVIAVQPDYPGARYAFAQAYLSVGDIDAAKREYEIAMRAGNLAPDEKDEFQRELARRTIGSTVYGATIDLALGYDDNVTSVTSESTIVTPGGTVVLDDDATGLEDSFAQLRGVAWMQKPLSKRYRLLAAGSALGRFNQEEDEQNYNTFDARLGLGNRDKNNQLAAYLFGTSLDRDSEAYQDSLGLLAQWRYKLGENAQLASFLRVAQLEYDDQDDRDALHTLVSITYISKLGADAASPTWFLGVNGGSNDPDSSSGEEFGYSLAGLNAGVEFPLSESYRPYLYAYYTERDFDADSSLFEETREDERWNIRLGVEITRFADWTIKPELAYTDNQSNLEINDYDRSVFSLTFRRHFN